MSDHWNSLANLLGTPSLSPQSKKSTDGSAGKTKEISPPHEANEVVTPPKATAKEQSKLRSGWDAVTSFFGIQSSSSTESKPELDSADSPPSERGSKVSQKESRADSKGSSSQRGGKRTAKPSFWTDDTDKPASQTESVSTSEDAAIPADVFASTQDEPVVSFGGRKRERDRNDRKDHDRRDNIRSNRESAPDKSESHRQPASPQVTPSASTSSFDSDDSDGPVERRSQRRAPRRGRSDDLDEGVATPAPAPRRHSERRESPSSENRRARTPETVREDVSEEIVARSTESRDSTRSGRGERDRPARERGERSERSERSRSAAPRTERLDRDVSDREDGDRPIIERESSVRDADEREPARRGRDRRRRSDETRTPPERRRPDSVRRAPVDDGDFGSGLRDSDDDLDELVVDDSVSDDLDADSPERSVEGARRGRNQRRGRRSSSRSSSGADDAERMEADESEKKFIKVPSWIEALDGILQSNMDNHQRGNHGRDRNRGRGPRTNDR